MKQRIRGLEVLMIRLVQSTAGIAILLMSPIAVAAQQTGQQTRQGPPASPSSSALERSYIGGAGVPLRRVQTRTESNGREIITETTERPGTDGKLKMSLETRTETVRTGADSTQTKHEVFVPDAQGRPRLLETTQTDVQTSRDGSSRSVANTMAPDINGRLALTTREIQETKTVSPTVKQTDTAIYRPGINEPLVESERLQQTERKVNAGLTESESTRFLRDANGRWQATEARNQEVRTSGAEQVAEETVRRLSDNGTLTLSERKVTRQTKSNGQDETVTESYLQLAPGVVASGDRLQLSERIRLTTTTTADRAQQTVREVEARNPAAPNQPLRVVERTVETFRQISPGRWEVQRQVFALDGNNRLSPVLTEKGESAGK